MEKENDKEDNLIQDNLVEMPEKEYAASSQTIEDLEDQTENIKKIEAALFISGRFLNIQDLIKLTDLNPLLIKELMQKLLEKYSSEETAIALLEKDNSWKMDVKQEYVNMINKLATGSSEFTKAEQETLAVIAYKQPVKQSVIVNIRGNKAYEHIKGFISLGLVKHKRTGHTIELQLSDDFYEYFHLSTKDRQDVESLEAEEESGKESVEKIEEKEE